MRHRACGVPPCSAGHRLQLTPRVTLPLGSVPAGGNSGLLPSASPQTHQVHEALLAVGLQVGPSEWHIDRGPPQGSWLSSAEMPLLGFGQATVQSPLASVAAESTAKESVVCLLCSLRPNVTSQATWALLSLGPLGRPWSHVQFLTGWLI